MDSNAISEKHVGPSPGPCWLPIDVCPFQTSVTVNLTLVVLIMTVRFSSATTIRNSEKNKGLLLARRGYTAHLGYTVSWWVDRERAHGPGSAFTGAKGGA